MFGWGNLFFAKVDVSGRLLLIYKEHFQCGLSVWDLLSPSFPFSRGTTSKSLIVIDILLLSRERLLRPNLFYFVFKLPLSCDSRWWNNLSLYGWWGIWEEATICIFRGGMSNFWYSEGGFYLVFWKLCLIHVELTGTQYNVWYTQLHFDKFISQGVLTNISNLVSSPNHS